MQQARTLEHDIEAIRSRLGGLVSELDRRRKNAMDVRLQIRRHPAVSVGLSVLLAGLFSMLIVAKVRQRRRARRLQTRFRRLRHVLAEAIDSSPRATVVAKEKDDESRTSRLLKAAGTAAASQLGRQLASRVRGAF